MLACNPAAARTARLYADPSRKAQHLSEPHPAPHLAEIRIFPIKSLPGIRLEAARIGRLGGLENDRRWMLVDEHGEVVHGKRTARIHQIAATFSENLETISVSIGGGPMTTLDLYRDRRQLEQLLSQYLGIDVELQENRDTGFPDDTEFPGPTVISTATLEAIAAWFPGLTLEGVRQRFRANLEIGGVPAFWEDRLVGAAGTGIPFEIGAVRWEGTNPCQRCVVPTRDAQTGIEYPRFAVEFARQRKGALPDWAELSRFDHYYRLAVNTRGVNSTAGLEVRRGDPVRLAQ